MQVWMWTRGHDLSMPFKRESRRSRSCPLSFFCSSTCDLLTPLFLSLCLSVSPTLLLLPPIFPAPHSHFRPTKSTYQRLFCALLPLSSPIHSISTCAPSLALRGPCPSLTPASPSIFISKIFRLFGFVSLFSFVSSFFPLLPSLPPHIAPTLATPLLPPHTHTHRSLPRSSKHAAVYPSTVKFRSSLSFSSSLLLPFRTDPQPKDTSARCAIHRKHAISKHNMTSMQSQQDQHLGGSSNNMDTIMAEQEHKLQSKYGCLPVFTKNLLGHQRKYFDSGDYALCKAGKEVTVGSEHPQPENIPHSIPLNPVFGAIPARRGSLSNIALQPNNGSEQQAL